MLAHHMRRKKRAVAMHARVKESLVMVPRVSSLVMEFMRFTLFTFTVIIAYFFQKFHVFYFGLEVWILFTVFEWVVSSVEGPGSYFWYVFEVNKSPVDN